MKNKKGLIISSIAVVLVLISIIVTIILVNIKRYSSYTLDTVKYNKHTTITITGYGTDYHVTDGTIYRGGVEIIANNTSKKGIYSYTEGKVVVNTEYDQITALPQLANSKHTYFRLSNVSTPNKIQIVNEKGEYLDFIKYDETAQNSYTYIKSRDIDLVNKRSGTRADIESRFTENKQYISDISLSTIYSGERYHYEVWKVVATDGSQYRNIYSLEDKNRTLIQTFGNHLGLGFDEKDLTDPIILTSGEIRLYNISIIENGGQLLSLTHTIYDVNYNVLESNTITADIANELLSSGVTQVGNKIIWQVKTPATKSKYTYLDTSTAEPTYVQLDTYSLNLKTGRFGKESFPYLINSNGIKANINEETTILSVNKIDSRQLSEERVILLNERLQEKAIDYTFNSITRISEDRLIAYTQSAGTSKNYVLIDNSFHKICALGDINSYFTTRDTLVLNIGTKSYICDHNGDVIKLYNTTDIFNIHDENYYLIKETKEKNGVVSICYYLESLGLRQNTPICEEISGGLYKSNNTEYHRVYLDYNETFTLLTRVTKLADNSYTYEISNMEDDILLRITNVSTPDKRISVYSSTSTFEDNAIIEFNGKPYMIDR